MMKKSLLAIIMAGLMLVTTFSAISVSAGYREHEIELSGTVEPFNPNPVSPVNDPPPAIIKGKVKEEVMGIYVPVNGATVLITSSDTGECKSTSSSPFGDFTITVNPDQSGSDYTLSASKDKKTGVVGISGIKPGEWRTNVVITIVVHNESSLPQEFDLNLE